MKMSHVLAVLPLGLAVSTAFCADYPPIKDGLWESTVNLPGSKAPQQSGTMCNSNAVVKAFTEKSRNPQTVCKLVSSDHSGSTYTSHMECNFAGRQVNTTNVTTFNGDTSIHSESHKEDGTVSMVSDMKYVGPCPAGMQPGDFVSANGMKFNLLHPEAGFTPPTK